MLREANHPVFGDVDPMTRGRVSDRIRDRLVGANARYHANDNISDFIEEGELQELVAEVQDNIQEVLRALVIDTASDHNTRASAQRVRRC